jgi:hypothetical protein
MLYTYIALHFIPTMTPTTLSAVPVQRSRRLKGRANKGVSANQFTTIDHPAVSLHTRKRVRNDGVDGTPSTSTIPVPVPVPVPVPI